MIASIGMIGFGEAGSTFASAWRRGTVSARGHDLQLTDPEVGAAMRQRLEAAGVTVAETVAEALRDGTAALSLVTAGQALAAAMSAADAIVPGLLWFDMNSVAPDTKRAAAAAIEAAGGRYVDVAVMAPVEPARLAVPLLLSGPHAEAGAALLRELGFGRVTVLAGAVGQASAIKMIRSVMVKGIEALTAECLMAAHAAGVTAEVLTSLDASPPPAAWRERADYNLDRMMVHGVRRAEELDEVVRTLEALGTCSAMTRAAGERQRRIGGRALAPPPVGLEAKLERIAR